MHKRTVIITGAAQGIGYAIAKKLSDDGYNIIITDINKEKGLLASSKIKNSRFLYCNISDENSVKNLFKEINYDEMTLYAVVNNAGIIADNLIWNMTLDEFEKVININLKGTWLMCREAALIMKAQKKGKIVNISSRAWLGNPGQTNYSASKAGIIGLSRALALELARHNISVNVVAPGLIDTPLTQSLKKEVLNKLINAQPTKNLGKVEDVAEAVSFFINNESNFITGQILYVDGGKSIGAGL